MEAKSILVQIIRSMPGHPVVERKPRNLQKIAETAATARNDGTMVRKGIRAMELLTQLQDLNSSAGADQFTQLRDEIDQELHHLGSLLEKVLDEIRKLEEVYRTIRDHNGYLVGQLETYKSYLHNVRSQSEGKQRKQQRHQVLGPYKFTHQQLEKEGVIQRSNVPENRRANIYFNFTSPLPGTFVISLHYKGVDASQLLRSLSSPTPARSLPSPAPATTSLKITYLHDEPQQGRNRGLLELDLKLDDLLEMQKDNQEDLDLEYVQFNVPKVLNLLNRRFARKKGW